MTSIREICDNLDHLWYQNYDLRKERGENMDDNVYRPTICGSEAYLTDCGVSSTRIVSKKGFLSNCRIILSYP